MVSTKFKIADLAKQYPSFADLRQAVEESWLCPGGRGARLLVDDIVGFVWYDHSNAEDYMEQFYYSESANIRAQKRVERIILERLNTWYGHNADRSASLERP